MLFWGKFSQRVFEASKKSPWKLKALARTAIELRGRTVRCCGESSWALKKLEVFFRNPLPNGAISGESRSRAAGVVALSHVCFATNSKIWNVKWCRITLQLRMLIRNGVSGNFSCCGSYKHISGVLRVSPLACWFDGTTEVTTADAFSVANINLPYTSLPFKRHQAKRQIRRPRVVPSTG
jgi:hypothetical protein